MIGYPFFYENEELVQDEKFMIFSLDPITENSELNLTQAASLPIVIEPIKLQLGDEFHNFVEPFVSYPTYPKQKLSCLIMMAFANLSLNRI